MSISLKLSELDTPSLLIDKAKLFESIDYCQRRAHELGVNWRPHVKTHKCAPIAAMQVQGMFGGITVSTVKEAEYMFDEEGITDIIYAVGIAPQKLPRIALLNSRGADVKIILDNLASAMAVSEFCRAHNTRIGVLLEIDCDGHRSGLKPDDPALMTVAKALTDGAVFKGVLTHAGDSYLSRNREELEACAANEVHQIMKAANVLKDAGYPCEIVSVGSTPTFTAVKDTEGVTEYRSGVGVFHDLVMAGLNVCKVEEIALSVLVTVIGHQPQKGWIITDGEHTRYIMSQIAEDFREMKCNREDNFCCGGGGGFNGIGKFRPQRDKGLYMKLQIRETGAKMVISPCHNCWDAIRDMMEVYHVHDIKWSFLKPIIIDMMIVPDHLKPQDDE